MNETKLCGLITIYKVIYVPVTSLGPFGRLTFILLGFEIHNMLLRKKVFVINFERYINLI